MSFKLRSRRHVPLRELLIESGLLEKWPCMACHRSRRLVSVAETYSAEATVQLCSEESEEVSESR